MKECIAVSSLLTRERAGSKKKVSQGHARASVKVSQAKNNPSLGWHDEKSPALEGQGAAKKKPPALEGQGAAKKKTPQAGKPRRRRNEKPPSLDHGDPRSRSAHASHQKNHPNVKRSAK